MIFAAIDRNKTVAGIVALTISCLAGSACKPRKSGSSLQAAGGAGGDCGSSLTEEETKRFEDILEKAASGEKLSAEELKFMSEKGMANLDLRMFLTTEAIAGEGGTPERARLARVARAFALAGITGQDIQKIIDAEPGFTDKSQWEFNDNARAEAIRQGAEGMAGQPASDQILRERLVKTFAATLRAIPEEAAARTESLKNLVRDYQERAEMSPAELASKAKELGFVAEIFEATLRTPLADGKTVVDSLPQNQEALKKVVNLGLAELRVKLAIAERTGAGNAEQIIAKEIGDFKAMFGRNPLAGALAAEFLMETAVDSLAEGKSTIGYEKLVAEARGQMQPKEFAVQMTDRVRSTFERLREVEGPYAQRLAGAVHSIMELMTVDGKPMAQELFAGKELAALVEEARRPRTPGSGTTENPAAIRLEEISRRLTDIRSEATRRVEMRATERPRLRAVPR